ncbi:hypothetical protein QBC47DRAFT_40311 [Echria macrotheca]|uniref:Uncharacterized protein n=1 Tax=Echria macrotheca TaxID=438768 RepID=A0AAJ0B9M7_9PEZI|nr:hypothetical protein QBC47DRAFT_40311 [Echria macrotheca]
MNRFRTKKRAKDDSSAGRTSQEGEHSSSSFFRRGKKQQPEETKKEIDLATALPSTDDFRTSLLMTNLSARFSMLREQDDPNTKIGKASDDSVLYPKRQSRLADFGFVPTVGGLADIAEVESIKAPRFGRTGSYASDDADAGQGASVLNRGKPTEGNNLFGGRQKIYKIPAGKGGGGGTFGRALYEDDVALSAFQRWRKTERERASFEGDDISDNPPADDDSEPLGYNRKRETSSTTSSASFVARNSTAATSITSQQTGVTKDWQSSTAPTSVASTPALDRSVTRTRRLYEQAPQEAPETLSKIDTFVRKPLRSMTPDMGTNSPSPTTNGFAEKLFGERRAALAKSSAPNLKSVSPPLSSSSSVGGPESQVPSQSEPKINYGGAPPLSPPISEDSDQAQPLLPIQPNDVGKATAMGVFQKPSQPYDESKYAQRQIQLQQGRETPTGRLRAESNASFATGRSRSSSSAHRQLFEGRTEPVKHQPAVQEEAPRLPLTTLEPLTLNASILQTGLAPQLTIERPSDKDHPAFRQSPLPTPLSIMTGPSGEPSPVSDKPSISVDVSPESSNQDTPYDSPTLGPTHNGLTGLSGMVRQHLRSESNASSIYGPTPPASSFEPQFPVEEPRTEPPPVPKANPWNSPGQEWTSSFYGASAEPKATPQKPQNQMDTRPDPEPKESQRSSTVTQDETDEFASQLADARQRIREKLTSYVESDSSRAGSPLSHSDSSKDLASQAPNALGIGILKPKSSRGSLIDRSRNLVSGQSKANKLLGIGGTMSTTPSPSKHSFDEKDSAPLETMVEETPKETGPVNPSRGPSGESERDENKQSQENDDDGNTHPGLRAFRQARRELQRRKELETLAKHQMSNTAQPREPSLDQPRGSEERGPRQRTPSRERRPPPVSYRQRAPSDEQGRLTNPNSPTASGERERSGSETSNGRASSRTRPPRLRGNTGTYEDQSPGNRGQPMLRAPGLPGTDIRRSPIMPPQGYNNRGVLSPAASPHTLHGSKSTGNLAVHGRPGYDNHSGLPSPISPLGVNGLPPSPYAMGPGGSPLGTPTSFGPRPRQGSSAAQSPAFGPNNGAPNGAPKRMVDKRDISDPTFVMSTSRVPTVNLPHSANPDAGGYPYDRPRYQTDNMEAPNSAPPVPPINPRRKRETSRPRPYDEGGLSAPRLPFASQGNGSTSSLDYTDDNRSAYTSDDEDGAKMERRRLRKAPFEGPNAGLPPRPGMRRDNSPPFVAKGPPASRSVVTSKVNQNMNIPGGMF